METQNKEIEKIYWNLCNSIRTYTSDVFSTSIALAYIVYKNCDNLNNINFNKDICMENINDPTIRLFVKEALENIPNELVIKFFGIDKDILKNIILYAKNITKYTESETPDCIVNLVLKLLNIKEGERVLDSCSGVGNFLIKASLNNKNCRFSGIEINNYNYAISKIRNEIFNNNWNLILGNVLDNYAENINYCNKYEKIFSNYPFGMRLKDLPDWEYNKNVNYKNYSLKKATSADWIFNYNLVSKLSKDGRAVAIMTNGTTFNTIDKPIREYFIKNNLIETVIALPEKLFPNTSIPVCLMVFSKENNKVNFVDANNLYKKGRRQNELDETIIDKIIKVIGINSENSCVKNIEDIAKEDFNLYPTRYIDGPILIKNGVPFKNVIKSITRGAPCSAKDLDNMISIKPTDYQYLMLANIKGNVLDNNLPYIKNIESKFEKYCVKDGDLLISKNGYPYKIAVVENIDNKKILANGNLFVIELDTEKIDPYYLKAFLESEQGIKSLKTITVGAVIPNIGVSQLNNLLIPLEPMEKQKIISNRYLASMDEIKLLKRKIEKVENNMKCIFKECMGD